MLGMRSRKKSGFSKFMNSMLGSPKFTIGAPENPVHLTHVGVDNETGLYTVGFTRSTGARMMRFKQRDVEAIQSHG